MTPAPTTPDSTDSTETADTADPADPTDPTDTAELHVAYPTGPPDFASFDVKTLTPGTLLGEPCTVAVVGQSHVVTAPALDYHEVCSCLSQPVETSETVALDAGVTAQVETADDRTTRATTDLSVRPLASFPGPDDATIAYRFGPDAWTTVSLAPDAPRYETYHTYPERDVAVHTVTRLAGGPSTERSEPWGQGADR
ncbi:DUF2617 family protein [Salinigranum halophilum]|uniref:DUF2617 family protein n=1 Tax=Salinigranum halophilum TaxID=2565931 RepID=UPI00115D0C2D|nr:DUF2617 family protein [Salinigranum halophilum]